MSKSEGPMMKLLAQVSSEAAKSSSIAANEVQGKQTCEASEQSESDSESPASNPTMSEVLTAIKELKIDLQLNNERIQELTKASLVMQASLTKLESFIATPNRTTAINSIISDVQEGGDTMGSAGKRKTLIADITNDEINHVIISLSDEEEENGTKKIRRSTVTPQMENHLNIIKPDLPASWTRSSSMKKGTSKYKSTLTTHKELFIGGSSKELNDGVSSPSSHPKDSTDVCGVQPTKLFHTPSPASNDFNAKTKLKLPNKNVARTSIPKGLRLKFKPTNEMQLNLAEQQAAVYLFHPEQDLGEILFVSRDLFATRSDFLSLCPGKEVRREMIALACDKVRCVQKDSNLRNVWCLPPQFEKDLFSFDGITFYDCYEKYGKQWCEPFPKLKYIYVPFQTESDNHCLMVISMVGKTIYQLDPFLLMEQINLRQAKINKLAEVLAQLVGHYNYRDTFKGKSVNFHEWPIVEARGIPICGDGVNSGVWVLDWLKMEHNFNPNIVGMLQENTVRMKMATNLLLELNNEVRETIQERAEFFWKNLFN